VTVPPNVRAAAERLAVNPAADLSDLFPVRAMRSGQRRRVWLGDGWVLKLDHEGMAAELPRWRRTPQQELDEINHVRTTKHRFAVPHTELVAGTVLVQERCDPNDRFWESNQRLIRQLTHLLGLKNLHNHNVGWRGRQPVFLDFDYTGPDLTVVLLWKRQTKRREAQGEAPFWAEWGPTYLQRMVRNVRRHLPADTRIVVMTDTPADVPAGCDVSELTEDHPGWWSKLWQFRRDVTCGRCLYLDLDNVVAGPLTRLLALQPDPMIVPDDRQMPGLPNGGAMLYFAERVRHLWDDYAADPAGWQRRFHESRWPHASDQAYIASRLLEREGRYMPFFQDLLGDGYVLNSRVELEDGAPWDKCELAVGCWIPKPHQSSHPFYLKHWAA
jgi:hypothetical protein